ncbi:IclR family transcriptional regulator [Chachezhania sediminis]|uniref:IclR family transcriptional regulator n=1 Tax=Chachezhania sediminis TaxID=2599291 RepID=UPI00131E9704|nr:helix-turn-helix domain-containing protein [Chachezhania sediminis]
MAVKPGGSSIKSAARAMALMEFFNTVRRPVCVTDICKALSVPQSSASMLVKCLTDLGYLYRIEGTRTYAPARRAAFLSDWALERIGRRNPLCDTAEALSQDLGETVVIGTQTGPYVQLVHVVSSGRPEEIAPKVGGKDFMTCTAAGRSLLSRLEDPKILRIARRNNAEAPPHARVGERRLLERIGEERRQGFFESHGGRVAGVNSISVLLSGRDDPTPLMIGVGGPEARMMEIRDDILSRLTALPARLGLASLPL